jgi:Carboxypeptidase regulatory-like domain
MKRTCFLAAFLLCMVVQKGFAEIDTASLEGRVVDSSGAFIVSAEVQAINVDTHYAYSVKSNQNGEWVTGPAHLGTYRVTGFAAGFQKAVVGPIVTDAHQRQQIDASLWPGVVTSTMEGKGVAPLLETDTSERSHLVDRQTTVTLPLNGRNPVQLAQLTVRVTTSEPGARDERSYSFSYNGTRLQQNNSPVDGIDNNSSLPDLLNEANYVIMPSVDVLEEGRVDTNSYPAEFGRATGTIVYATVKSGTNSVNGDREVPKNSQRRRESKLNGRTL